MSEVFRGPIVMNLDLLWKAIVPLAFLAIWALTALFNRDAKPLPNRLQSSPNPYGPKPIPPAAIPRTPPPPNSQPTLRWTPQGLTNAPARPGGADEIVILESSRNLRPTAGKGVAPARRSKAKTPVARLSTSPESKFSSTNVTQTVNQQISTSMTIQPLSVASESEIIGPADANKARSGLTDESSRLRLGSIAALMSDPARIREAILINELLQPPVSLRKGHRRF